jgi:hypothetical protein
MGVLLQAAVIVGGCAWLAVKHGPLGLLAFVGMILAAMACLR